MEDFYKLEHTIHNENELYSLYELWEEQRLGHITKQLGSLAVANKPPQMTRDVFVDWLVKRGICPHAIATANSRYHFENVIMLDSEMGLHMPDPKLSLGETPGIFFNAVNIVRSERAKAREEDKDNA